MAALFNVILRKATYHFRRRVPDDLRPCLGRSELMRSLATSDPRTAKLSACRLCVASENLFSVLRTTPMLIQAQLTRMVQDFYTQLLDNENLCRLREQPISDALRAGRAQQYWVLAQLGREALACNRLDQASFLAEWMLKRIRTVHLCSRQTYGAPRVHADLREQGERHSCKRIARPMREAGLVGASHRRGGPVTTRRDQEAQPAPGLVDRNFRAEAPNRVWVADITSMPTAAGFLYLAVVLDAFRRRIVGRAMTNHLRSEWVLDALEMAVTQRRPRDVIHQSDSQTIGASSRAV